MLRNHRGMQLLHVGIPAHRARATTAYLNANKLSAVDFLPKSPDLNIIENIWDELNCCVRRTWAIPITLIQLRANILYEWNNLPPNCVQRYAASMRHRCISIVNSAGVIPTTKFTWTYVESNIFKRVSKQTSHPL